MHFDREAPQVSQPQEMRRRDSDFSVIAAGSEEDHFGAIREGIQILKENPVRGNSKKYIVLVTDEGQRRYKAGEEQKLVKEAKRAGVEIHLLYSKESWNGWLNVVDDFSSLINLAVSSGGGATRIEKGRIPNVFNTDLTSANFVSINFKDTNPYEAGTRTWTVANGEGASCSSNVSQQMIEDAISQGRLEVPTEEETKEEAKDILPLITKIAGILTLVSVTVLTLLTRKKRGRKDM